ncbi:hypothetical protein ACFLTH_02775 [Bacteroidota bacterium]
MEKSYNDEQYNGISKILKDLPRINAPDNFEFNLMTRIENGNFETVSDEKQKLGLFWKLTPSLAVAVSAIILFFVWNDQLIESENPLMFMPQEIAMTESEPAQKDFDKKEIARNEVAAKSAVPPAPKVEKRRITSEDELYRVVVRSNDAVSHERVALDLEDGKNVDLDSYLNGNGLSTAGTSRSRLVGAGETFEFNGFYIREQTDRRLLEMIKSRIDSINKARIDSTADAANIPE